MKRHPLDFRQYCGPGCQLYHAGRNLDPDLRRFILDRDRHRCRICRARKATVVDHIWPRRLGGTDHPCNLQAACRRCNAKKYNHRPHGVLPLFSTSGGELVPACGGPKPWTVRCREAAIARAAGLSRTAIYDIRDATDQGEACELT